MALLIRQDVVGQPVDAPQKLDPRRKRLSTIVARHADRSRPFIVSVSRPGQALMPADDTVVMRGDWRRTLVPRDATVVITYLPMGGGGRGGGGNQGKAIGGALAMIALAVVAPYAVGALGGVFATAAGGLTLTGKLVAAGIVMGGGYLISKATQAKANKQNATSEPLYGVSGGGNMPQPGGRIPVGYGQFWTQPDLSQPDYIINDGEDQVLYKRMTLGLGKYDIERINVGQATLWTPDGGIHETFVGGAVEIIPPGGTSSLVPGTVISSPDVAGAEIARANDAPNPAWSGPWPVTPPGITTKKIQIDFSLPHGCYMNWGKDGRQLPIFYDAWFEYAPIDDNNNPIGGWNVLYRGNEQLNTTRAQRFTRIIDVAEGRYAVRAQNTQPAEYGDAYGVHRLFNDLTWDGLRAPLDDTIIRPDVTEIAVRIRSGKTLVATSFADIWVRASRRLPVWNGSSWEEQPTRKAVWAWCDIMRSAYGGNLVDSQIDVARALHYASTLTALDSFDGIIRGPVSVHEAASTVLGVIRADPVRIGNTWSIGRDEPRAVAKHLFTRRQIVRDSSQAHFQVSRDDGQADVIVEYYQDSDPRRRREVRATFGTASLTPRRYSAAGVSTYEHAHHLATWMAAAAYYRRERRTIVVEHEGRLVSRGDPARVDVWYMSDAVAAGVMGQAAYTITLDTDVEAAGKYAIFRSHRNREWGPVSVSQGGNARTIVLHAGDVAAAEASSSMSLAHICDDKGGDMPSVLIGPLTELQDAYIVDSATPQGRDRVTIEAVRDSDAVWSAIGQPVPPEPDIPSRGDMDAPSVPIIPWLRAAPIQKTNSLDMEWAVGVARGAVRYVVSLSYDDGATWETVSDGPSTSGTYTLRFVEGMAATVAAFAVTDAGVQGPTVYATIDTYLPVVDFAPGAGTIDWDALSAEIKYQISLISAAGADLQQWIADYFAGIDFPKFDWSERRDEIDSLRRRLDEAIERLAAAEATTAAHEYTRSELIKVELAKGDLDNWAAIETERTARIAEDEALATVTTALGTRLTDAETGLTGQAAAISALSGRVTDTEDGIESVTERVDILESGATAFAPLLGWNFRTDLEGWTGNVTANHDATNGLLYYTKNATASAVWVGSLSFPAAQAPLLRIRYRRATGTSAVGAARIRFKSSVQSNEFNAGNFVDLPATPNTNWITATVRMTDAANWLGTISLVMFLGSDGIAATDRFEIDYIEVGGPGANVSAFAHESLKTSVTANADGLSSVSSRVTDLESAIEDPDGGLAALASAYDGLETRVESTETGITTASSRITALEASKDSDFVGERVWDFGDGVAGWFNSQSSGLGHDASLGVMTITKQAATHYVWFPGLAISTSLIPQIKIRYRRATGSNGGPFVVRFATTGSPNEFSANNRIELPAAPANGVWVERVVDVISVAGGWHGNLSMLMMLPSDGIGTGSRFEIDYIAVGRNGAPVSASAFQRIEARVEETEDGVDSLSSSVTSLTNAVAHPSTGLAANASAINSLTNAVSSIDGTVSSHSSSITALQNTVNNPTTGVSATATALGALTTRVTDAEGDVDAVSGRVSALEVSADSMFVAERGFDFAVAESITGWFNSASGGVSVDVALGVLNITKQNTSHNVWYPGLNIPTSLIPKLKIRYRRNSGSNNGPFVVRFATTGSPNEFAAANRIELPTPTVNGQWIERTVDVLTVAGGWHGALTMLMIRPSDGVGSGSQFQIDYIAVGRDGVSASAGSYEKVEAQVTSIGGQVTAQVSSINTLQLTVGDQTSQITALQQTVSGPGGLTAQYGVSLDLGQGVQGGFKLLGARRNDGSGGTVQMIIDGDLTLNGTITAPKLITNQVVIGNNAQMGGNTVNTGNILNNAVSNTGGFYQYKLIDEQSDAVEFNVRPGAKVLVWGSIIGTDEDVNNQNPGRYIQDMNGVGTLQVTMNEVAQTEFNAPITRTNLSSNGAWISATLFAVISPGTTPSDMWRWFRVRVTGASFSSLQKPRIRYMIAVVELAR